MIVISLEINQKACNYLAGVIIIFLNSIGPWSPCIIIGPEAPSLLSNAPPVIPGISFL
jgi:hypothetical protein